MSNIGYSKIHSYTVEKVKEAMQFVNKSHRNTPLEEWIEMYEKLKGVTVNRGQCRSCAMSKYVQGVKNYAKLGYAVLLAEGHSPEEFIDEQPEEENTVEVIENEKERIVLSEEEPKTPKKKAGRPKKNK